MYQYKMFDLPDLEEENGGYLTHMESLTCKETYLFFFYKVLKDCFKYVQVPYSDWSMYDRKIDHLLYLENKIRAAVYPEVQGSSQDTKASPQGSCQDTKVSPQGSCQDTMETQKKKDASTTFAVLCCQWKINVSSCKHTYLRSFYYNT